MDKLQIAKEALKDFKKYKDSKKCRHYKSIIQSLRTIPCGVGDINKNISQFQDFIPSKDRKGIPLVKVVEIVLQFYVGYYEAMSDTDLKKTLAKQYAKIYYQKNKERMKASSKVNHEKNRSKRIKDMRKRYHKNALYNYVRYRAYDIEYKLKNKKKLSEYGREWYKKNKLKVKKYMKKYSVIRKLKKQGKRYDHLLKYKKRSHLTGF
jgi:hypothetical protein